MPRRVDLKEKYTRTDLEMLLNHHLSLPCRRIDHVALQHAYKRRAEEGEVKLREFTEWLVGDCGYRIGTATQIRRRVWAAIEETDGEPWYKLDDLGLSSAYRKKIYSDLRKWATFIVDNEGLEAAGPCIQELIYRCPEDDADVSTIIGRYLRRVLARRSRRRR